MIMILLMTTLTLGLSESIEPRLPTDAGMIYTVGFDYGGVKIGLDWKNRQVVADRVCRKATDSQRSSCQQAAIQWLQAECGYYAEKSKLTRSQMDMQQAVCDGANALQELVQARSLVGR